MGKYYNREKGPIAVTLKSGKSFPLQSHVWVTIPSEEEGSEELLSLVRKGFVVRQDAPETPVSEPTVEVVVEPSETKLELKPEASEKTETSEKTFDIRRPKK